MTWSGSRVEVINREGGAPLTYFERLDKLIETRNTSVWVAVLPPKLEISSSRI